MTQYNKNLVQYRLWAVAELITSHRFWVGVGKVALVLAGLFLLAIIVGNIASMA